VRVTRRRSLNRFAWLRDLLQRRRERRLASQGVELGFAVTLSQSAVIVPGGPGGVAIGSVTAIGPMVQIDARQPDGTVAPIRIGSSCFIGAGSVIAPGVTIGNQVIVAAGAVVLRSMPGDCVVAGNPARVVRRGIDAGYYGMLPGSWETQVATLGASGQV